LDTIAVILLVLWLLGMVSGYTIGSFIHILLVVALIMILVNFISGRRGSLKQFHRTIEMRRFYLRYRIALAFLLVIAGSVALVHASVVYAFQIEMATVVPIITGHCGPPRE